MINITKCQFLQFVKTKKDNGDSLSKATHHYLAYFDKYMATGKKGNWNFFGAFPFWFFYRRMYLYGYLFFPVCKIMEKIEARIVEKTIQNFPHMLRADVVEQTALMGLLPMLVLIILCMRYADYIYLVFASKKISKGITTNGVNANILLILAAITLLCFAISTYLSA